MFRPLSPSSGSNLKMALRTEICSWDIYISDNIVVFKTVYPRTIVCLWVNGRFTTSVTCLYPVRYQVGPRRHSQFLTVSCNAMILCWSRNHDCVTLAYMDCTIRDCLPLGLMPGRRLGFSTHLESPATGQLKRYQPIDPGASAELLFKLCTAAACFLCGPHCVSFNTAPPVVKAPFSFTEEIWPAAATLCSQHNVHVCTFSFPSLFEGEGGSVRELPDPKFCSFMVFFPLWRCSPTRAMTSSFLGFRDHTQRRATVGRTPLDEWSARRRDLYLTTHDTHNRQTSMSPVGFELTISAGERPQTYALDRAAAGTGCSFMYPYQMLCLSVQGPVSDRNRERC